MANKVNRSRIKRSPNKIIKLSQGESLLIWRRREGWNQGKAAKYYNVSLFSYKLAEYSQSPNFKYKKVSLGELSAPEKCLIYRKRSKKTQKQVAKELGICRYWLRLQEQGVQPCNKLLAHWEAY